MTKISHVKAISVHKVNQRSKECHSKKYTCHGTIAQNAQNSTEKFSGLIIHKHSEVLVIFN